MSLPLYLDYNATTPVDPAAVEAMLPYLTEHFGNPSSTGHVYGWLADEAVTAAREKLGGLLNAPPEALAFTGGATEAVNLAIKGVAEAYMGQRRHFVTLATEHKAVLACFDELARKGFQTTVLPVEPSGLVDLGRLEEATTDQTALVAIMWANNETGIIQPLDKIAPLVRAKGALLMSDATQAVGKIPVDVEHVDLLACSGHKMYAPKGVGALYARRRSPRVRLASQIVGGGHENGLRSGTLNVPSIVAMGAAAALAQDKLGEERERLRALRDRFEVALMDRIGGVAINGAHADGTPAPRLPQTSNLRFEGVNTKDLLPQMRGLAVSTGSACQTKSTKPSHVLSAMGLSDAQAFGSVRFSFGRFTTEPEVDEAIEQVVEAVEAVRQSVSA